MHHHGRSCNCGSIKHNLRWCTASFQNGFSLLNPEFATHDPDGYMFDIRKKKMLTRRRKGPSADTNITVDATRLAMALRAPTTRDTIRSLKVLVLGSSTAPDALERPCLSAVCGPGYALLPNVRQPGTFRI